MARLFASPAEMAFAMQLCCGIRRLRGTDCSSLNAAVRAVQVQTELFTSMGPPSTRGIAHCTPAVHLAAAKEDLSKYDLPKRPLPAYMRFLRDELPGIRASNPGKTFPEVAVLCGQRWREMSEVAKRPYLEAFEAEMAEFKKIAVKKETTLKTETIPKKLSAYSLFFKQNAKKWQAEEPGMKLPQLSKKASAAWKALSDEEKAAYKQ